MKKVAAIDIGTNSMRLLLAEVTGEKIVKREKHLNTTRIGKSVDSAGYITKEGIDRNLKAFKTFVEQARQWGADEILAIATSAVRDAENGQFFVEEAFKETGVAIRIIDGKEEALIGYKGVLIGLEEPLETIFLIDIGGGSTELIIGNQEKILEANSYNVGAVRMTERYIKNDPPTEEELEILTNELKSLLITPLKNYPQNIDCITGIGGTATTIAALHQQLDPYDMEKVHGYQMELKEVIQLKDQLKSIPLEERKKLKGLEPKRADIIVAGIIIMITIMELLNIKYLKISEYDNLEGQII
ncbi:Ppx/GppA phosphatase family protein [Alkaliphilus transvaalensis]|uniref:Ppx/GppA phosphatase family protein n=1 Tax=Alkaliphilus transvaalensis TaxID=114628 RepID=UPI00047B8689|nr:Ppx/GppA phosphatase family protein [Alkaliphilus transvaalensis]